jgi:hypothetical protein
MRWIEETYLAANPDVAAEVKAGKYDSDEEHCMKVGSLENREAGSPAGMMKVTSSPTGTYETRSSARCSGPELSTIWRPERSRSIIFR